MASALDALFARVEAAAPLTTEHDPAWPSPCEIGNADAAGQIRWAPVRRDDWTCLEALAEVMGRTLHPAIETYYGRYWFDRIAARAPDGEVELIGVWNAADHDRLLQNLLGHVLQQRRQRAPESLFIACTEPDPDLILTVANDSGEVLLERPGTRRFDVVAADLAGFLASLEPA